MTNFEYYKDEIKKYIDNMANFTVSKGEIIDCDDDRCGHCEINDSTYSPCEIGRIKWLYEEHKETPKLTAREYNILKVIGEGYLTKDQDGKIFVNVSKPKKYSAAWISSKKRMTAMFWPKELFNFIKWEDDEPYSVEEMLTWEHEEED